MRETGELNIMESYALGTLRTEAGVPFAAIIQGGRVLPLARLLPDVPDDLSYILAAWEHWEPAIAGAMLSAPATGWIDEADLFPCLPYLPNQLLGAGANYRKHVIDLIVDKGAGLTEEMTPAERRTHAVALMDERAATGTPYIWVGSRAAIAGSHDTLILPHHIVEPDWELELAVVIGKPCRRATMESALDFVAGYTIANDVTARELVDRPDMRALGMDWLASKNPPGFNIIGPYITPARFVPDPQALHIRLSLNGRVMQDEGTSDMIFTVARLIAYASQHALLSPGDIIMTGSPSGNGTHYGRFLRDGDVMTGAIDGLIGAQATPCALEQRADTSA